MQQRQRPDAMFKGCAERVGASVKRFVDTGGEASVKLIFEFAKQREQLLKQRGNLKTKSDRRARVSAVVFLCLMMHALFVCLTHHHDTPPLSRVTITASDSSSQTATGTGSDTGCLSCRLQRHFVADPHAAAISVEFVAAALLCETLLAEPHIQ